MLNTQPFTTTARRLLGLLVQAGVVMGLATWGGAACGSEAVCPIGTQGDPCLPVTDLGSQPELPTASDTSLGVWDALGADVGDSLSQADAPATNQDSNSETHGTDTALADTPQDGPDPADQADQGLDQEVDPSIDVDGEADTGPHDTTDTTGDTPASTDSARAESAATQARVAASRPPRATVGASLPWPARALARRLPHRG